MYYVFDNVTKAAPYNDMEAQNLQNEDKMCTCEMIEVQ